MTPAKGVDMDLARTYGRDYWDGDRRHGYGGYTYDGRWKPIAQRLIDLYALTDSSSVLDLGCGKAHLLYELKTLLPGLRVVGLDISSYALETAPREIQSCLVQGDLRNTPLAFANREFDLVLAINSLHNLHIRELFAAVREVERIGRDKFIAVESYRTAQELTNLQCWALTCAAFYNEADWQWIFEVNGYRGDHEFIFFE
jgi:ubiquinone/menaquinone biosynthesis C-methylase UbiE